MLFAAVIALFTAGVSLLDPSPVAPKSLTFNTAWAPTNGWAAADAVATAAPPAAPPAAMPTTASPASHTFRDVAAFRNA